MTSKYFTKSALMAANETAKQAGGNCIDPAFLQSLPGRFKFPCLAVPFLIEKGWIRCWVTAGRNLQDVHDLLLDMRMDVYEGLPTVAVEEDHN